MMTTNRRKSELMRLRLQLAQRDARVSARTLAAQVRRYEVGR